jgi:hypothetical protein
MVAVDRVEYAGFRYTIVRHHGGLMSAEPEPGQHPAAGRERHRRTAYEHWERYVRPQSERREVHDV